MVIKAEYLELKSICRVQYLKKRIQEYKTEYYFDFWQKVKKYKRWFFLVFLAKHQLNESFFSFLINYHVFDYILCIFYKWCGLKAILNFPDSEKYFPTLDLGRKSSLFLSHFWSKSGIRVHFFRFSSKKDRKLKKQVSRFYTKPNNPCHDRGNTCQILFGTWDFACPHFFLLGIFVFFPWYNEKAACQRLYFDQKYGKCQKTKQEWGI